MANSKNTPSMEAILRALPPDVDPFAYIENVTLTQMALNASQYITGILTAFLVFHAMIFGFCMFILVMSLISGTQQARWIVKSLYIKDPSGQKVYESPLYFNAGFLMAIVQLLCSVSSGVYIWIQIKSFELIMDQIVHAKIVPPRLSAMFIFESFSHWILTHCFFVTVYFSGQFTLEMKKGIRRWISPPIIINSFFSGFTFFVLFALAGLAAWTTFNHHRFAVAVMKVLDLLRRGSWDWKHLRHGPNLSDEEISHTSAQLAETVSMLKKTSSDVGPDIEDLSRAFHWHVVIMCFITSTIFANTDGYERVSAAPSTIRVLMLNKQFVYLLLRAIGVFLSMMCRLGTLIVMLIKNRKVIAAKSWRDFVTWIVIASGAWSAIPIVWQCRRLYTDQTNTGFPSTNCTRNSTFLPKKAMEYHLKDIRTRDTDLEIKNPNIAQ